MPAFLRMPSTTPQSGQWRPAPAFPRQAPLAYPVGWVPFPGNRLLVYTQGGQVFLLPNDPSSADREEILDLRRRTMGYGDTGLLNVVLHPEFGRPGSPNRGHLYVWYATYEGDFPTSFEYTTWNRLSRFTIPDGGTRVDPGTELVLIEQADRHLFHAGGGMFFHPDDGFLYLAVADEGSQNDALESAQQVERGLFSGVLRIDVDQRGGEVSHPIRRQPVWGRTQHYFIPNDNPWVGEEGVLEEFWAIGLRNPHRLTQDPVGGRAWIADVGQLQREEINVLERGANYGW
ncbi:MAG: PQQ-dependent sugar dehydrogenase, partial [Verrucomicrobiota bacterium]